MKKLISLLLVMAVMFFAWIFFALAHAQDSAKEEKPTFYRLVPGTYVNGWPRFTIHYPKDWVERRRIFLEVFDARPPGSAPKSGGLGVHVFSNPHSVDKLAEIVVVPFYKIYAQDVTVVSDKPTQLRDGTPAREVETKMVMNGEPITFLNVATKKGDMWVNTGTNSYSGKIEEYQREMFYSLRYEPSKDEPVKVPPDVQDFLDRFCSAAVAHDLAKVMTHYSDRFLNSGNNKGLKEQVWRQFIGFYTSSKWTITDFVPKGDRAYLTGFIITNFGTVPIIEISIIKENGEWKWYGNQRDAAPRP